MDVNDLIEKLSTHTIKIYKSEISQMAENNKTVIWLLGLASAGLLFSFNKYSAIGNENRNIIIFQALIFILIIVVGFIYRRVSNKFTEHTISIIRMFDFLRIGLELVPNLIENEIETEKLDAIFENYLNGEYFQEEDQKNFETISMKQTNCSRLITILTTISIILMILVFSCFFLIIF